MVHQREMVLISLGIQASISKKGPACLRQTAVANQMVRTRFEIRAMANASCSFRHGAKRGTAIFAVAPRLWHTTTLTEPVCPRWGCERRARFAFCPRLPAPTLCRSRKQDQKYQSQDTKVELIAELYIRGRLAVAKWRSIRLRC